MFRKDIIILFYFYASLRGSFNKDLHHVLLRRARNPVLLSYHSERSEESSITKERQKETPRLALGTVKGAEPPLVGLIKLGKNSPLTFIRNTIKSLFKRSFSGEKSTKKL